MAKLTAKPSILKFISLDFLRVYVEADFSAKTGARDFDYRGARVGFTINHSKTDAGTWNVAVGFITTNEKAEAICPYEIDIQALGVFSVADSLDSDRHEKLVYENGSALVYGAIRDMVSSITSRAIHGPLMLPTATFMGSYDEFLVSQEAKKSTAKPKKTVSQKKLK